MVTARQRTLVCYMALPPDSEFHMLREAAISAGHESGAQITFSSERPPRRDLIDRDLTAKLSASDLVIAEVSDAKPEIIYEIGVAHSLGRRVIPLVREGRTPPSMLRGFPFLTYEITRRGIDAFRRSLADILKSIRQSPQVDRPLTLTAATLLQPQYFVDLGKLSPREFENLCFELITQMGFKQVEWSRVSRGIDIVATLPKKDPDGYEYQELWLIVLGRRARPEAMVEMALHDPDLFYDRVIHELPSISDLYRNYGLKTGTPSTFLFILRGEGPPTDMMQKAISKWERYAWERRYPTSIRIRWWGRSFLSSLVNQHPQVAYKYFSDEARARSRYRKSVEELYGENVVIAERLEAMKSALEEEKKKRFIAERSAAWKDVAFKAAHKLGNPIDAVDNFLLSLERKVKDGQVEEALAIMKDMNLSIEEAKSVIAQFKSLAKSQEMQPQRVDIYPIIEHACKSAVEKGVKVSIHAPRGIRKLVVDPERMTECFGELVANSLHWFDKASKTITVRVRKVRRRSVPDPMDRTQLYLRITFEDNGCGVPMENKEKIFAPFFTTSPHGTGLGLSLVKWTVEAHGGRIVENGKPGVGASFDVYLPLKKRPKTARRKPR